MEGCLLALAPQVSRQSQVDPVPQEDEATLMQVPVSVGKQQPMGRRTEARLEEEEPSQEERIFSGVCIMTTFLLHQAFRLPEKASRPTSLGNKCGVSGS